SPATLFEIDVDEMRVVREVRLERDVCWTVHGIYVDTHEPSPPPRRPMADRLASARLVPRRWWTRGERGGDRPRTNSRGAQAGVAAPARRMAGERLWQPGTGEALRRGRSCRIPAVCAVGVAAMIQAERGTGLVLAGGPLEGRRVVLFFRDFVRLL